MTKGRTTRISERILATVLAFVMLVSLVPISVFASSPGTLTTDIGEKSFVVGTPTEFTFTTKANDDFGTLVKGSFVFSDPAAIDKLEYKEINDGNWYEFSGEFGPDTGFPMSDATSQFRVTFKKVGVFTVSAYIKTASDGTTLCSAENIPITVNGRSTLTTNIENTTFVVGETTEFEFTTMANDDANIMVLGSFEFSNTDALDKLEYKESTNGEWYEFDGDFGPDGGFPFTDNVTSYFRATFNTAGTYTLHSYMKRADNGEVLCFNDSSVVVKERAEMSYGTDAIEIKYSDTDKTNDTLSDDVAGAEYTYSSNNESVVKVDASGILQPIGIGEATITATRVETESYVPASASYTVTVVKGDQDELTWVNTIPEQIKWNTPNGFTNTVTGGSGDGAVSYESNNTDVAEVNSNTGVLTLKKPGTVKITATKAGGTLYEDEPLSYTLTVIKSEQGALAFAEANPNAIYVGDEYTNVATGGSTDETIVYEISDDTIASIDANGKVTALKVPSGQDSASVEVTASLAGNDYYEDATSVTYTITIYRAPQKTPLVFEKGVSGQKIKYGDEYTNAVSGGDTTPVTYSSSDQTVATVDANGKVTALKAGTVTITATVPQSEEYQAQTLSYELVIELATQTVSFTNGNTGIPAITYGDSYQNKATAKTSITYSSSDETVATVDANGNLVINKSGTITVTATAGETEQYAEATESYTITINKAKQTISFKKGTAVEVVFNDNENKFVNPASSVATIGDEDDKKDIEVLYSVASGSEFIVDDTFDSVTGAFEIKGAGTVIVTVSFTANDRYATNMASYTLVIKKDEQTIAFGNDTYDMINGDNGFVAPTASEQGTLFGTENIIYSIDKNDDGVASAVDAATGALTFTNKTGEVTILATKPADANYNKATATYVLTVKDAEIGENVFHTIIGEKIDLESEWYTGNVSVNVADGYLISYAEDINSADWKNTLENAVTTDGVHDITFYVRHVETGKIYEAQTVTIKKDATVPTAEIKHENLNGWEKILSIITLGLWEPSEMNFAIDSADSSSGVKKVEYLVVEDDTDIMSKDELDSVEDWISYNKDAGISVASDKKFVVYTKVTDNAGQYIYATTNGIVFDRTAVPDNNVKLNIVTDNSNGFYDEDVEINVTVEDAQPSSGIKSVSYEVKNGGIQTQTGTLFQFDIEDPTYAQLVSSWDSADDSKNIIVDSALNNSDNVKVIVTVVDNAGNETKKEISLKICIDKPTIDVSFIDDPDAVETHQNIAYYDANRMAKIVITERTSVYNASNAPVVTVTETKGDTADGKTYEVVDWETADGDTPDDATHTYLIKFNGSANYEFSVDYTDIFGNELTHTSNKFVVDHEKPTATITVDEDNTWTKLLETLTFGLWKNEQVTVSASSDDATSPIKKFEMYRTNSTDILNSTQLDELYAEGKFAAYEPLTVSEDAKFVVYIRVEDYAGHYDYICSDGFVVDTTDSVITLTPEETTLSHNDIPLYNGDVDVRIDVVEKKEESYSGIKEVKYWVTCDGTTTQEEVLYTFDYDMSDYVQEGEDVPTYSDLLHEFTKTVTIESAKNNSCNVVLNVKVTDNAGNEVTESVKVDIDDANLTAPTIKVEYDNNSPYKIVGERGYYPANRTATIVITERTGHFEADKATAGIKVKAVDAKGDPIIVGSTPLEVDQDGNLIDISKLFGEIKWETEEGATPDQATHTLVLPYVYDANYTFAISYKDLADNSNEGVDTAEQKTPYEFTVDKVDPTATITANSKSWDKLLEVLTFGLYDGEKVNISATSDDVTSPIESVKYYKTDVTTILGATELDSVTSWTDITSNPTLDITDDEKFVVYLKVTDYAGNYLYINSDGYVVDKTDAFVTLTPEETELSHNDIPLYNEDVDVLINVVEKKDESYSGIKEVKYWVTCDGTTTQEEVLYSFDYDMSSYVAEDENVPAYSELLHEFAKTVTVDSSKNNSCDVVVYAKVTDNAGNVVTESVKVDIDITDPTISVQYDNNSHYNVVEDRGYYPANRTATIVITERTGHFEADKATADIKVKAVDAKGNPIVIGGTPLEVDRDGNLVDISKLFGEISWNTQEGTTPDDATHTLILDYSKDANYTFAISYEDLAANANKPVDTGSSKTPYEFTVDKVRPTGTVKVGEWNPWDKLIETLTFGLWSRDTVSVTATRDDVTSPIESWNYYKTTDTTAKTESDLKGLSSSDWKPYADFSVSPDEQFTVYIRIVDFAGNTTYISTDGVIVDHTAPVVEKVAPEITLTAEQQPANGIYNKDVRVAVKVVDPTVNGTYSGLKEVRYEVYSLNALTQGTGIDEDNGILYSFTKEHPTQSELYPVYEKDDAILVSSAKNNSNEVLVKVFATDNSGNTNQAELKLKIDITAPTIDVSYDNNDGDTAFADAVTDAFFKANRTATIVITERNFNADKVVVKITNTDGIIPELSGWKTVNGTGNGDGTTHTATVTYSADGDYTFDISYIDQADNANEPVTFNGLAPQKFTVDKTLPTFTVVYDNNDVQNGNYYKAQRIASITVNEHNFETSRIQIALKATDNGADSALPAVSNWTSNGDIHTATISYVNDSLYTFDFDYTDKAGNATTDIEAQTFYVDKTNPAVSITKIVDESANNDEGNIGYVITATDTNFDVFTPVLTAVVKEGTEFKTKKLEIGALSDTTNGKVYTVTNIENDGIYRITSTVVDKAGNAYSEVSLVKADGSTYTANRSGNDTLVTFSVNRDGSTFELNKNTAELLEKYYVQKVTDDIVVVETNADPLQEYKVTLNGKDLSEDQYKVDHVGGGEQWDKYTYTIDKSLFEAEGEYTVVVSSKDKAMNDAFSDVKDAGIKFVVDRTAPVVTVTGLAKDGRYQTDKQTVTVVPTDDGGALKSIVVTLLDRDGKAISELLNLSGDDFAKALEDGNGQLTFEVPEGLYQSVRIVCDDMADFGTDDNVIYDVTITNISVASSAFLIFWANKPLRWGSIGGVVVLAGAVAALAIIKKRKKGIISK